MSKLRAIFDPKPKGTVVNPCVHVHIPDPHWWDKELKAFLATMKWLRWRR